MKRKFKVLFMDSVSYIYENDKNIDTLEKAIAISNQNQINRGKTTKIIKAIEERYDF